MGPRRLPERRRGCAGSPVPVTRRGGDCPLPAVSAPPPPHPHDAPMVSASLFPPLTPRRPRPRSPSLYASPLRSLHPPLRGHLPPPRSPSPRPAVVTVLGPISRPLPHRRTPCPRSQPPDATRRQEGPRVRAWPGQRRLPRRRSFGPGGRALSCAAVPFLTAASGMQTERRGPWAQRSEGQSPP